MSVKSRLSERRAKTERSQRFGKTKVRTRVVAFSLAALVLLSMLRLNLDTIVDLLAVNALVSGDYFVADFDLYDYYASNNNTSTDGSFNAFNQRLYDIGYVTGGDAAKPWGDGTNGTTQYLFTSKSKAQTYYPLFLGLQYKDAGTMYPYFYGDSEEVGGKDSGRGFPNAKYNYSLAANSGAKADPYGVVQGLVDETLSTAEGDGTYSGSITQGDGLVNLPYFDSGFVTSSASHSQGTVGTTNLGNKFRFRKHTGDQYDGYYVFKSSTDGLTIETDNGNTYYSADTNGTKYNDSKGNQGFFPLGAGNYGFGAVFTIDFTISKDGETGSGQAMQFNFEGDDDVWVYVDGHLCLDLGGAHGACSGNINFKTGKAMADTVVNQECLSYSNREATVGSNVSTGVTKDLTKIFNQIGLYGDATKKHTLTVFYLERGTLESNCLITFNFSPADTLTVNNVVDVSGVNDALKDATLLAARREGVQYRLQNKGAATDIDSPDDRLPGAEYDVPLPFPIDTGGGGGSTTQKVTLTYKMGDGTEIDSYEVSKGSTIRVMGDLGSDDIILKGWSTDASATEGDATYAPSKLVTVTGNLTLYAKTMANPRTPVAPTILYANHTDGCGQVPSLNNGSDSSANKLTQITGNYYGYLLTYSDLDVSGYTYLQHNQFNGDGNSQYGFNGGIAAGDIVYITLGNSSSHTKYTYTDYSGLNSNVKNDWLNNYVKLYNTLINSRAYIVAQGLSDISVYTSAYNTYVNATFGTSATTLSNAVTSLGNAYGSSVIPQGLAPLPEAMAVIPDEIATIAAPGVDDETTDDETEDTETTTDEADSETDAADVQTAANTESVQSENASAAPAAANEPAGATVEREASPAVSGARTAGMEGHWVGSASAYANVTKTNYQLKYINGSRSVIRQTENQSDGQFNLLADQSAKFSLQFSRNSGVKLSQTGNSWYYQNPETTNTSVRVNSSGYYGAAGILSKRYSTKWELTDDSKNTVTSTGEKVGYSVFNSDLTNCVGNFDMDYIDVDNPASGTEFVHLTAAYTNTVRVTDITITKALTDKALPYAGSGANAKKFKIKVTFSKIFGDENSDEILYAGTSAKYLLNGTEKTVAANGVIEFSNTDVITIQNVPVYTSYTITEIQPDGSEDQVIWGIEKVTYHDTETDKDVEINVTKTSTNNIETAVTDDIVINVFDEDDTEKDAAVNAALTAQVLSVYTAYKVRSTNYDITVTNTIRDAYLIINKTIDHQYYYSTINGSNTDDPADLRGITTKKNNQFSPTVGGATGSDNDCNGYQEATEAEQTFIFKITEYANNDYTGATKVFYETISFGGSGADKNVTSKYKVLCVDPNKSYMVTEMTNWSWKYSLQSANDQQRNSFTSTITKGSKNYENAAEVSFTNNKKTDNTRKVEGDTSVAVNIITKTAS